MKLMKLGVIPGMVMLVAASVSIGAQNQVELTEDDIDQWVTELSNWERWGEDDQLGAFNLITPEKRRQAAALVKEGISFSLARPLNKEKAIDNASPLEHVMIRNGVDHPDRSSSDSYSIAYHGFSQTEVTREGAAKLDILTLRDGVFTRAVLIDIPKLKGVPYLEAGVPVYPEDLEAWENQTGVRVSSGDVVFVRTGRWVRRAAVGPFTSGSGMAGLHASPPGGSSKEMWPWSEPIR
jgi:hypothetical protein